MIQKTKSSGTAIGQEKLVEEFLQTFSEVVEKNKKDLKKLHTAGGFVLDQFEFRNTEFKEDQVRRLFLVSDVFYQKQSKYKHLKPLTF